MEGPGGEPPGSSLFTGADCASVISNLHSLSCLFEPSEYLLFELSHLINKEIPPRGPLLISSRWKLAKRVENR